MSALSEDVLARVLDLIERPALLVSRTGEVLLANTAAARLGTRDGPSANGAAELTGRRLEDLLDVEDADAVLTALRGAGGAADGDRPRRLRVAPQGSSPRVLELLVRPLSAADREGPCCVLLREEGPGRPAEPSSVAFTELAHDLRQPVQAAVGYAELLSSGMYGSLAPRQAEAAERVRDAVQRLMSLVEATLIELGAGKGRAGRNGEEGAGTDVPT